MDAQRLIDSLEWFAGVLPAVVQGISDDDVRWKPADGAWSILEIVCHLHDEERRDFRPRLQLVLASPTVEWPPIDPEQWAVAESYNTRALQPAVSQWLEERRASLQWLRGLVDVDWDKAWQHPRHGPVRAGDLLAAWAAHDALHLRQIAKRAFQLAQRNGAGYDTIYAGEWRA